MSELWLSCGRSHVASNLLSITLVTSGLLLSRGFGSNITYPYQVPIQDLPLKEIIRAAQHPYKLSHYLERHPERISTSSKWFELDAVEDSCHLLNGGRWMICITSNHSHSRLAIADLSSIEDSQPKIHHEPPYGDNTTTLGPTPIEIRAVQWHPEARCAVVLITHRDEGPPAVVEIEWDIASPNIPLFHPRIMFDLETVYETDPADPVHIKIREVELFGEYCTIPCLFGDPHISWN